MRWSVILNQSSSLRLRLRLRPACTFSCSSVCRSLGGLNGGSRILTVSGHTRHPSRTCPLRSPQESFQFCSPVLPVLACETPFPSCSGYEVATRCVSGVAPPQSSRTRQKNKYSVWGVSLSSSGNTYSASIRLSTVASDTYSL